MNRTLTTRLAPMVACCIFMASSALVQGIGRMVFRSTPSHVQSDQAAETTASGKTMAVLIGDLLVVTGD